MTAVAASEPARAKAVSVTLHVAWGCRPQAVQEMVASLRKLSPAIVWREPTPTRARLDGFIGLEIADSRGVDGAIPENWPDVALDEARLFWGGDGGSQPCGVHLVAGPAPPNPVLRSDGVENNDAAPSQVATDSSQAVRWAVFWEDDGEQANDWIEINLGPPTGTDIWTCLRVEQQVLTLRDAHRYGLEGHDSVPSPDREPLSVFQYFCGTELVFWRLMVRTKSTGERPDA